MTTVRNLLDDSLSLIGIKAQGITIPMDEYNQALRTLNQLTESYNCLNTMSHFDQVSSFNVISGTGSYVLGVSPSPWVLDPIPNLFTKAFYVKPGTLEEVEVPFMSADEYASLSDKTETATDPLGLYISNTRPTATVYVWPVPSASYTLKIWYKGGIPQYSMLTDTISLPQGYLRMLKYNLAIELAAIYGVEPSGVVVKQAALSIQQMDRQNRKPLYSSSNPDFGGGSNNIATISNGKVV